MKACPFCGNPDVKQSTNPGEGITFITCGGMYGGEGGCGAVVSFRPRLMGRDAIAAWDKRNTRNARAKH